MSKVIDERVVEMRFDNKDYEKNAHKSIETTEKLKKSLNFEGTSKGLSTLGTAIGTVSHRFSVMDVIGVTALANIANSAVNTGKRMLSALTIDPVKTGLSEYETKINSIQTIMSNTASKGTTMDDVTKALNELNTYADKTIYNFAEMTRNIGTFTAAGIELDSATKAIQGIANLAAASGSTSQQASTAMYQLSQALSTGTVRLMDWNSVVNASMGGELFQNALKETAREMGVAVDDIIKKSGSFRESLSENWLSADILNTTLKKFTTEGAKEYADSMVKSGKYTQKQADDLLAAAQSMEDAATKVKTFTQLWDTLKESAQSGWAQTWEIIIGNFEEAKEVLSDLSDIIGGFIGNSAESRNKMLTDALSSKWGTFTEEINKAGVATKDFEEKLKEVAKKHGISIDEMIENQGSLAKVISSGKLSTGIIVETLKNFIGETDEASKSTENLSDKLEYFQKVVDEVWRGDYGNGKKRMEALSKAGYDYATVQDLVNKTVDGHRLTLDDLSDVQLKSIGYTEDQIKSIRELAEEAEKSGTPINELIEAIQRPSGRELLFESLKNSLKGLFTVLESVGKAWGEVFPKEEQSNALYKAIVAINEFSKKLVVSDETAGKLVRTFKGLFAIIDIITTIAGGAFKIAFKVLNTILGAFDMDIWDLTARIGDAIVAFRDWIDEHNIITKAIDALTPHLKKAADSIKAWIDTLKKSDNIPRDIVLGLVNGFKNGIKTVITYAKELGTKIIEAVKDVLGIHSPSRVFMSIGAFCLSGFILGFTSQTGSLMDKVKGTFNEVINWVSNIDWDMVFLGGLTAGTVLSVYKIANALETLAAPFDGLADIFDGIGDAVQNFSKILGSFSKLLSAMAFERISKSLVNFAIAIAILAGAIALLTLVDHDKLLAALGTVMALMWAMGGLMVALTLLTKVLGNFKDVGVKAAYIASLGITIMLIAGSIAALGMLKTSQLAQGVAAIVLIGLAIAGLMAATKLLNTNADVISNFDKTGRGFKRLAWSFILIAASIKILGSMSLSEIAQGGAVIVGIAAIYVLIMRAIKSMTIVLKKGQIAVNGIDSASKMITKLAWSIILIGIAMKLIATMSWEDIGKGAAVVTGIAAIYVGIMAATRLMTFTADKDKQAINSIDNVGKMFGKMGFAILAIAVAIKLLGSMPTDKLIKGGVAAGLILGACVGIMAATRLLGNSPAAMRNLSKLGVLIGAIGGSMLAMAFAIMVLGNLPTDEIVQGTSVVLLLMGACVGIMAATRLLTTSEDAAKALSSVGKMMIMFSVSIAAIAGAMYILSIIDPDRLNSALSSVMIILAGFAGIMYATKSLKYTAGSMGTLIVIVSTIAVLMGVLIGITFIDPDKLKAAAVSITSVLVSLALIMSATKLLTGGFKSIVTLVAIVGAVVMIGKVLSDLAETNPQRLEIAGSALSKALLGVAAMLIALSIVSKIMSTVSWTGFLKGAAYLVVAIGAMYLMLPLINLIGKVLTNMGKSIKSPSDAIKNALALSIVLAALVGVYELLSIFKGTNVGIASAIGCLALLAGVMGVIGLVLAMMSAMKVTHSLEYATVISLVLLALTGIAYLMIPLGAAAPSIPPAIGCIALLVGVIALIGLVLAMMSAMKVTHALEYATVITLVLAALVLVAVPLAALGFMAASIALGAVALALIVGVMALIGSVLIMMDKINVRRGSQNGETLTKLLVALVAVGAVVALLGPLSPAIIMGSIGLAALVGVMALAALVLNMMDKMDMETGYSNAVTIITVLKELTKLLLPLTVIGMFGLAALAGIGALVTIIAAIGTLIVGIGALNRSFPWLSKFLDSGIPILIKIGSAIGEFAGTIVDSFLETATQSLPKVGKNLSSFIKDATPFFEGIKNIDDSVITGITNLSKALLVLAGAELMDAITSKIPLLGKDSTDKLGTTIKSLGEILVNFNESLGKDFDASMAEKAATAMKKLVEVMNMLPKEGGVLKKIGEFFGGTKDTAGFGEMMSNFGTKLRIFANNVAVGGFGNDEIVKAVDKAIAIANKMVELAKSIPNTGGLAGDIAGNNDLDTFGTHVSKFATNLSSVSKLLSSEEGSLNEEVLNKFISFTKKIIEASNDISNTGGLAAGIAGDNDLGTFGASLESYAQNVKNICDTISNMMWYLQDDGALDKFIEVTGKLVEVSSSIGNLGGLKGALDGDGSLKKLGDTLVPFAEDLNVFTQTIQNVNPAVVKRLSQITDQLIIAVNAINNVDIKVIKNFGESLSEIATSGINETEKTLKDSLKSMRKLGEELADAIIDGFSSKSPYKDAASTVVVYITDEVDKAPSMLYDIGVNIVEGLADGIKDFTFMAVMAAQSMAAAVEEAARVDLEVNSPSKVFRRIGMSIPEGFAQGIGKLDGDVTNSAKAMGDNAVNSLRRSISRISEAIDGGMDVNPTIAPVIDLTNVRTGVDAIGNLLDFDSQVGVMANVGAANAAMSRRNQNGANSDVVSELAKLRKDLGKTGNTTYNIEGITYDDGSNVADAVSTLVRAARIERRI